MQLQYLVKIEDPKTHIVKVQIVAPRGVHSKMRFFLPSWSPGSYLMREYSRHVRSFKALTESGANLYFSQVAKGIWEVDLEKEAPAKKFSEIHLSYEVYCHELTVRTSHVDESHAFLHGPTYLMGVVGEEMKRPRLKLEFPPLWSKVSTALKDVSEKREEFIYEAQDYDSLVDTPIEIGCHETDGFRVENVDHELAIYGRQWPHNNNIKKDTHTLVKHISDLFQGMPYDKYTFIVHFVPGLFGGLEHSNSCALQFDGTKLANRKNYLHFLSLVAHEYFHTWNVKRIRPKELGPFNYVEENYTRMLWLAEGLTSFMDDLLVWRAGLSSLEEYLDVLVKSLNRYYSIPGRRFHSLEDSSYNAWIKLYRPDENSHNSSMSYYLKGGLVFFALNTLLWEKKRSVNDLLALLWKSYQERPQVGLEALEVFEMVEKLSDKKTRGIFETMVQTTEEIDFEAHFARIGLTFEWEDSGAPWLGLNTSNKGDRVVIESVELDGPAYKSGLNAGDEILAINGARVLKDQYEDLVNVLVHGKTYNFTISRLGLLQEVSLLPGKKNRTLKQIQIKDRSRAEGALKGA